MYDKPVGQFLVLVGLLTPLALFLTFWAQEKIGKWKSRHGKIGVAVFENVHGGRFVYWTKNGQVSLYLDDEGELLLGKPMDYYDGTWTKAVLTER